MVIFVESSKWLVIKLRIFDTIFFVTNIFKIAIDSSFENDIVLNSIGAPKKFS